MIAKTAEQLTMDLADVVKELREIKTYLAKLTGEDPNQPQECREKKCSYYQHYLAYGPADLTHEGFHAAERNGLEHFKNCPRAANGDPCGVCTGYEQRLRA